MPAKSAFTFEEYVHGSERVIVVEQGHGYGEDTFDAILSDRPYRKGSDYATARQVVASETGQQFEPRLVEAFLRIPEQKWEEMRKRMEPIDEAPSITVPLRKAA